MNGTDILIRGFKACTDRLDTLIKKIDTLDKHVFEASGKIDVLIGQLNDIKGINFLTELATIEIKRSICPRKEEEESDGE